MGRYNYFFATFAILPVLVIAGVIALFAMGKKDPAPSDAAGVEKDIQLYLEIRQKLLDHYDGELDETDLRNAALMGLAQGTGDRFTRVLPPVEARAQDQDLGGSFFGIGVYIEPNEDGSIRITGVQPDGGAEKAGMLVDDVIVAVDGISVIDQTYDSSIARIKSNEENSVVKLTVHRGGNAKIGTDPKANSFELEVVRSRVITYSVHDVHIEERAGKRFGYLHISDINANTFDPQFKDAIVELSNKGAEGFVIDLRGNGGGRVSAAVDLVDGLLKAPDQTIVFTHSSRDENRAGDTIYKTKDDTSLTELPIVVLIDEGSASAAEIITGALKDTGRAYIVGERSYGKGIVQTIFRLQTDPNYSVNITTTQYFTPLGRKVQRGKDGEPGGILPDLEIRYREGEKDKVRYRLRIRQARNNRDEIAKSSSWWNQEDRMLDAALDVLAGKPVTVGD